MEQSTLNFIFIAISFALYIVIAVRSRAASTKEYYTAGGGVSPFANGMATAADWMSAATFISMAGTVAISGYDAARFLMGWTGGFVLTSECAHGPSCYVNLISVPPFQILLPSTIIQSGRVRLRLCAPCLSV